MYVRTYLRILRRLKRAARVSTSYVIFNILFKTFLEIPGAPYMTALRHCCQIEMYTT